MSEFTNDEIRVLKALAAGILGSTGGAATGGPQPAAPDSDLDGQYGNPTVKKDPKRWAGESYAGASYSDCPPDYLECLAESLEYFASLDAKKPDPPKHRNGKPWYEYNLKDARLARGWARRNKAMAQPARSNGAPAASRQPAPPTPTDAGGYDDGFGGDDSEIPF